METNIQDIIKNNMSNIIIIISMATFIIAYITLKATDLNNKAGILALQILSLMSMIILIITIAKKFMPQTSNTEQSILEKIMLFLLSSWEYIKNIFFRISIFLKDFFINLFEAIKDIFLSFAFPDLKGASVVLVAVIGILGVIVFTGYMLHIYGVDIKYDKIKQHVGAKKIIYSVFTFLIFSYLFYEILPKLYKSEFSPSYRAALLVALILIIGFVLMGFFTKEIFAGNYRNYGMLLFNVLIFFIFIYFIYGIKKFFFDPKSPTLEPYSTFEYFLYYYLFPICFFIGYILYYVYVYRKENLSFTDFSDYRVIIFDILSGIILLYLIYQFIIKQLLFVSTDSSVLHFIQSVFKVIPCIFTAFLDYLAKNPSIGVFSIGISALFIYLLTLATGNVDYNSWYMILIYIIGTIMFIAGIIKLLLATTSLGDTKAFKLLEKTIFTLPCLFLLGIDKAFLSQKFGTAFEFLFIVLVIFFIFFYNVITTAIIPDLYEKYILNDGKQVINNPIPLDKYSFISSYSDLFNFNGSQSDNNEDNPNKFDYKYGLSFWFYLDSFAPLNSQLYDICCLGDGLIIKYNPVENTLYFMYNGVKKYNLNNNTKYKINSNISEKNEIKEENFENKKNLTIEGINRWNKYKIRQKKLENFLSKNGRIGNNEEGFENNSNKKEPEEIIIHKEHGILLQRWNNIIINYYGGTLDIFINGKMINSKINVAPYIKNTALTVGKDNGIHGNICNLVYYKSPINKSDIYRIYHIFKNKNPPVINKSDTNLINFGESIEVYFSELLINVNSKNNKDNKEDY